MTYIWGSLPNRETYLIGDGDSSVNVNEAICIVLVDTINHVVFLYPFITDLAQSVLIIFVALVHDLVSSLEVLHEACMRLLHEGARGSMLIRTWTNCIFR